ncbi:hypothetical protein [Celerinatantimonas diazotrophica]|uniref:Uncharacterized protein n=1 Tax=Celerinatantimonas diazotrophica TaxID=412034 RepID=A0A4R1KGL5_9GAMM|nr:hypothetical protein [Celerinatantimonas diazotrophica]TCK63968.1 hypothetical protein EV690_0082 [Celerinatantimonas diazotrophica]CAG9297053.1 hypothetical protein CEDIAZO_02215 [Celerinatantimonas diazotrophica]
MSNPLKSATATGLIVIVIIATAFYFKHPFAVTEMIQELEQTIANYVNHILAIIVSHIQFSIVSHINFAFLHEAS